MNVTTTHILTVQKISARRCRADPNALSTTCDVTEAYRLRGGTHELAGSARAGRPVVCWVYPRARRHRWSECRHWWSECSTRHWWSEWRHRWSVMSVGLRLLGGGRPPPNLCVRCSPCVTCAYLHSFGVAFCVWLVIATSFAPSHRTVASPHHRLVICVRRVLSRLVTTPKQCTTTTASGNTTASDTAHTFSTAPPPPSGTLTFPMADTLLTHDRS